MKLGILYSSGKDSTFTLWYYLEQGWDVSCLLSLLPENPDSYMFQNPSKDLLERQATSLGMPLLLQETAGEEEQELEDLKKLLEKAKKECGIEGVGVGALASDYQHERVNRICEDVGLKTYAPLWHKEQEQLLREMIDSGFDIRMTRIAADGLSEEWLGKQLTQGDVDQLVQLSEKGFHVGGEGGEFETIVLDGPIFSEKITISFEKEMETAYRGELLLSKIKRYCSFKNS
ncbi:MAG: diphthine--ammonia ligase [Candidatus Woesearchaeota archaeon]|nr:diphthine--ammonia ligase [Candidatus Woesearchaeota archaeon]